MIGTFHYRQAINSRILPAISPGISLVNPIRIKLLRVYLEHYLQQFHKDFFQILQKYFRKFLWFNHSTGYFQGYFLRIELWSFSMKSSCIFQFREFLLEFLFPLYSRISFFFAVGSFIPVEISFGIAFEMSPRNLFEVKVFQEFI